MQWKNLTYTAPLKKGKGSNKEQDLVELGDLATDTEVAGESSQGNKKKKYVLNNINGYAKPGALLVC